ncbi:MAG: chloride channel protein [Gemmatimonadetes bacterium]|nr:MAG: chloride channel protein [Gemmatimonadota bacterium]
MEAVLTRTEQLRRSIIFLFLRLRRRHGFSLIYALAILVGYFGGLGSVLLHRAILWGDHFFFGVLGQLLVGVNHFRMMFLQASEEGHLLIHVLPHYRLFFLILIPAGGIMVTALLIRRFAPEAAGHGVPEVMVAVARNGGVIPPHVALVKTIGSALTISTGGSVGHEGPSVQIGGAIGSAVGQFFRMSSNGMRVLVGCGAAAGISASFNAPIAGALFAAEIILGDFAVSTFSPVIVASVIAAATSRAYFGNSPAFEIAGMYTLNHPVELPLYIALGIVAGFASLYFIRVFYWVEDRFEALKFHYLLKAALGGSLVGLCGLVFPQLFGIGYEPITSALAGRLTPLVLLILILLKPIISAATLGGGGSGGVFAPALFMGALLGDLFGQIAHGIFPMLQAAPGAFALVGMAALVAGTMRASLTAILMIFEITGSYEIILPLMLVTVTTAMVTHQFEPYTIYTLKLAKRGIHIGQEGDVDILGRLKVAEEMITDIEPVEVETPVDQILARVKTSKFDLFPVVNASHELVGTISFQDLRPILAEPGSLTRMLIADDVMNRDVLTVTPDASLLDALHCFGVRDVNALAVVDGSPQNRLIGILRRPDVLQRYRREVLFAGENTDQLLPDGGKNV